MGIATFRGESGLVPGHAYSLLEVFEIHDSVEGEQQKVTDFFPSSPPRVIKRRKKASSCSELGGDDNDEIVVLPMVNNEEHNRKQPSTIRLVRIRNPWGTKEWKGEWSHNSDKWTRSLRKRLGKEKTFAKGDWHVFHVF